MQKTRKSGVHIVVFLIQLKRESAVVVLATFARIVAVILQTEDLIFQIKICLFGLSIGCETSRVFLKYPRQVDTVKEHF